MDDQAEPDVKFTRQRSVRFTESSNSVSDAQSAISELVTPSLTHCDTGEVQCEVVPESKPLSPGEVRGILRRPVLTWSEGVVPKNELRKAQSFGRTFKVNVSQRKRSNSAAAQFFRKRKPKNNEDLKEVEMAVDDSPRLSGRFVVIPAQEVIIGEPAESLPSTSQEEAPSRNIARQSMKRMTRLPPSESELVWIQNPTNARRSMRQADLIAMPGPEVESTEPRLAIGNRPQTNQVLVTSLLSVVVSERLRDAPTQVSTVVTETTENDGRPPLSVRPRQQGRAAQSRNRQRRRTSRQPSHPPPESSSSSSSSESLPTTTRPRGRRREAREIRIETEEHSRRKLRNQWPHEASPIFAFVACTLGLLNISRFSILTVIYGGNFIVQFVVLSFIFGIPLFCFFACLGRFLRKGILDMWSISPVFRGIGIAMLFCQTAISIYSVLGTAYVFFYFRDSLMTVGNQYKWGQCYVPFRGPVCEPNSTFRYEETVPDYFHGAVLQREGWDPFSPPLRPPESLGSVKFEVAFNLAVIWLVTFISISKGITSLGKSIIAYGTLPIIGFLLVAFRIMALNTVAPPGTFLEQTSWGEFFVNTLSWISAAREVFMTWSLNAMAIMHVASRSHNKHLRRDISLTVCITMTVLLVSGFFGATCVQLMKYADPRLKYSYVPSSYETGENYKFMERIVAPGAAAGSDQTVLRNSLTTLYIVGGKISQRKGISGYMIMRQEAELFPAVTAILGAGDIPPVWPILFYISLAILGLGQQVVIWQSIASALIATNKKKLSEWETPIALLLSILGFFGSMIFATSGGISAIHFMDMIFGSGWVNMVLCVSVLFAVLIVRGRSYRGEAIVSVLGESGAWMTNFVNPMLAFIWSVLLPIGLIVLAITSFRHTSRDLWSWRSESQRPLWPNWLKQLGCAIQLIPIAIVPLDAVVTIWKVFKTSDTNDILVQMQNLYRPAITPRRDSNAQTTTRDHRRRERSRAPSRSPSPPPVFSEAPPKYTPPPTYNTATGARIAKIFRESIRRIRSALPETPHNDLEMASQPAPPTYNESIQQATASMQSSCQNTISENQMTISELNQLLRSSVRRSIRALRGGRELRREATEVTLFADSDNEIERPRTESTCSESAA